MDRRLPALAAGVALALLCAGAPSRAEVKSPDIGLLQEQARIKSESEHKIQTAVLDPILGKNTAMPFVDVEMEIKLESEESTRSGMGLAEKYKEKQGMAQKAGMQTTFVMPGIPRPKTISANASPEKPESATAQQAQQIKGVQEERFAVKPVFKRLGVTVMHDDAVLKDKAQVDLVRSRIVEAMAQYQLQPDAVVFRPTAFNKTKTDWREDLKKPEVYLPLLFASLLLLFLLWLFGPLRRFLAAYVQALREKPAAEVNVESKIEQPDDKDGENGLDQEGKLDINLTRKPDEPPPPPAEEDDEMKKFEPFSYIAEANVKRLAYMFILRKEEPWVVAVVASYLKPELARALISALPVELQAKVALEALTVRQVTRDQVIAIDTDVKENVDFVVGGMERLTSMLDEADATTRNNILTYLKNEKPMVYEAVRRAILTFEDVVNFPDREMQVVVRELKTEAMARALQGASPEITNKFFSNMSAGAASLLKESMEYAQGLTPAQIEEERAKILDVVKTLEREGKITVREKTGADGGYDLVEGMQEELGAMERRQQRFAEARRKMDALTRGGQPGASAPAPAGDPAQAQQYYDAAVSYYNQGQADASVQYFETALQMNPSLWEAHQYLGGILYQAGRTSEAMAHYEQMVAINPDPQLRQWLEGLKAQAGGGLF